MLIRTASRRVVWAALLVVGTGLSGLHAQQPQPPGTQQLFPGIRYARGQDVSPTYEGWELNPDGTFSMWFGYFNRNSEEEVDVPIGPENRFDSSGNGDQGQPAHFYPGAKWWVFKTVVPKDWPKDKRLVWTLTNKGRTNLAKGWLGPEWQVEKAGITSNGYNYNTPPDSSAEPLPPVITGSAAQTITLPATATLAATVTGEGGAAPNPQGRGGQQGLRLQWILYRGPGKVRFDPAASPAVSGKPSETKASFSVPGNYRIRAMATAGRLFSTYDIDVKVN